jgi:hypothetical protein
LKYITLEPLVNLVAIAFVYLWNSGFHALARLLTINNVISDSLLTSSGVKDNVDKELMLQLTQKYTLGRVTSNRKTKVESVVYQIDNHLTAMVALWTTKSSRYVCPDEYLEGVARSVTVPSDLKNRLMKLYIQLV